MYKSDIETIGVSHSTDTPPFNKLKRSSSCNDLQFESAHAFSIFLQTDVPSKPSTGLLAGLPLATVANY